MGNCKQIIVVRSDLKLGKGKIASHVAHASISAIINSSTAEFLNGRLCNSIIVDETTIEWLKDGQAKITCKVDSEQDLLSLKDAAEKANIKFCLIKDAGHTQIDPGTYTAIAIGPEYNEIIDSITNQLKLL